MKGELREGLLTRGLAATCVFGVLYAATPPWPDDWDGVGFLASIRRFDLDAFAPHPPGYPVYVALLKVAHGLASNPVSAASLVSAFAGAVTMALLSTTFGKTLRAPPWASVLLSLAVFVTPLGFRFATAVGSEAPALALVSLAIYGLACDSPVCLGLGVGLALGARLSWAPLVLPMMLLAAGGKRVRAWAVLAVSTLAWALPLVAIVGAQHLGRLYATHLAGHANRWGGTALTDPSRARFLFRDVLVDGLGVDSDGLGVALGVALVVAAALALDAYRRARWPLARSLVLVVAPYLTWIILGQNLREQPRHALPLVVLLAGGLAAAAWVDRRTRVACAILFALVAVRTGLDASARWRDPPAAVALSAYVAALPDAEDVAVFGGASARFFDRTAVSSSAHTVESMGDVEMTLTRLGRPPSRVFVTSEVSDLDLSPFPLTRVVTFCRPPRIDRKHPCLDLYEGKVAGKINP